MQHSNDTNRNKVYSVSRLTTDIKSATPEQAEEAHAFVRGLVTEQFGQAVADGLRIQYGGSVKPDNAAELMAKPNVDGALVGGAALKADSFAGIVKGAC